jgi:hypothetical protein
MASTVSRTSCARTMPRPAGPRAAPQSRWAAADPRSHGRSAHPATICVTGPRQHRGDIGQFGSRFLNSARLCASVLPKPKPGSMQQPPPPGCPPPLRPRQALAQIGRHLGHHFRVDRIGLHGPRHAAHVHQTQATVRLRDGLQGARRFKAMRTSLIMSAPASSAAAMTSGFMVSTERATPASRRPCHHRQSPAPFPPPRRPGRCPAASIRRRYPESARQPRAGSGHVRLPAFDMKISPPIGKRIRRDIDDAHDQGLVSGEIEIGHKRNRTWKSRFGKVEGKNAQGRHCRP